jgi:hypothetical protein
MMRLTISREQPRRCAISWCVGRWRIRRVPSNCASESESSNCLSRPYTSLSASCLAVKVAARARRITLPSSSKANDGCSAMYCVSVSRETTAQVLTSSVWTLAERGPPSRLISPRYSPGP